MEDQTTMNVPRRPLLSPGATATYRSVTDFVSNSLYPRLLIIFRQSEAQSQALDGTGVQTYRPQKRGGIRGPV